jgi:hypothetical protein
METAMSNVQHFHATLDAAKNAQARLVIDLVRGLTTRTIATHERKSAEGEGLVALVAAQPATSINRAPPREAARSQSTDTREQRASGSYRSSSPCFRSV